MRPFALWAGSHVQGLNRLNSSSRCAHNEREAGNPTRAHCRQSNVFNRHFHSLKKNFKHQTSIVFMHTEALNDNLVKHTSVDTPPMPESFAYTLPKLPCWHLSFVLDFAVQQCH